MGWLSRRFVPDLICETVFDLPEEFTDGNAFRAIIFDIDNTLAPYDRADPDEKTAAFLKDLASRGIRVVLVSNNSAERVERFNRPLGFFCVPKAGKPNKKSLRPALAHFEGIPADRILFVGDQLLTDVLAARRNGIRAAVVKPIKRRENPFFRFKRLLERPFIRKYYKDLKKQNDTEV